MRGVQWIKNGNLDYGFRTQGRTGWAVLWLLRAGVVVMFDCLKRLFSEQQYSSYLFSLVLRGTSGSCCGAITMRLMKGTFVNLFHKTSR